MPRYSSSTIGLLNPVLGLGSIQVGFSLLLGVPFKKNTVPVLGGSVLAVLVTLIRPMVLIFLLVGGQSNIALSGLNTA